MVVAIDGPSGVGKSTVAREVARRLGLPHLDTGSNYRAAAVAVVDAGANPSDAEAAAAVVEAAIIDYRDGVVLLDGVDVTERARSPEVTAASSLVAVHPAVRRSVVARQRAWVGERGGSAVVEGRDIGSVVFPDAAVKVYLTARPEVRAARRSGDPEMAGRSPQAIAADMARRDRRDSTRSASPLEQADDAVVIDTSDLTVEEVVQQILDLVASSQ